MLIWLLKNQYHGHHNLKIFVRKKDGRCAIKGSSERKHFPQFTVKKRGRNEQTTCQETNQHKQSISLCCPLLPVEPAYKLTRTFRGYLADHSLFYTLQMMKSVPKSAGGGHQTAVESPMTASQFCKYRFSPTHLWLVNDCAQSMGIMKQGRNRNTCFFFICPQSKIILDRWDRYNGPSLYPFDRWRNKGPVI